jgi:hypothetical protein
VSGEMALELVGLARLSADTYFRELSTCFSNLYGLLVYNVANAISKRVLVSISYQIVGFGFPALILFSWR